MKPNNIIQYSLIFICILFLNIACNKNRVPNKPRGSNTICCKINGVKFETSGADGGNNISCHNEVVLSGGLNGNTINAKMCDGKYHSLYITLFQEFKVGDFEIGGTGVPVYADIIEDINSNLFLSQFSISKGVLKITDVEDNFIAGEFNFFAKSMNDSTEVKVTDGKFDIAW